VTASICKFIFLHKYLQCYILFTRELIATKCDLAAQPLQSSLCFTLSFGQRYHAAKALHMPNPNAIIGWAALSMLAALSIEIAVAAP
jgi:hypothetical protein